MITSILTLITISHFLNGCAGENNINNTSKNLETEGKIFDLNSGIDKNEYIKKADNLKVGECLRLNGFPTFLLLNNQNYESYYEETNEGYTCKK